MKTVRMSLTPVILVLMATVMSADPRAARMELEPGETLPGLPVKMVIRAHGGIAVPTSGWVGLRVHPEGKESFLASGFGEPAAVPIAGCEETLRSGERILAFSVDSSLTSPWFADSRLNQPGVYRLQMVFSSERSLEKTSSVSEEAVLTVVEPRDADAAIWARMKQANPQWSSTSWSSFRDVAEFVWDEYPNSGYAPYVIMFVRHPDYESKEQFWDDCLRKFPSTPIADWVRFEKAKLREQQSLNEMAKNSEKRDVNRAIALADAARALYLEIDKNSDSGKLRKHVDERLHNLRGRDYFFEQDRLMRAGSLDEQ